MVMPWKRRVLCGTLVVCLAAGYLVARPAVEGFPPRLMRVLLAVTPDPLQIGCEDGFTLFDGEAPAAGHTSDQASLRLEIEDRAIAANGLFTGRQAVLAEPRSGSFSWDGRVYRGTLAVLRDGDNLLLINRLPLEEYLRGVLPSEVDPRWPEATLQAQAIAARSFATVRAIERREAAFDLDASTLSQVYRGLSAERPRTDAAVLATAGRILVHRDRPVAAFFHANCGGRTAAAEEVWGSALGYLVSRTCTNCSHAPHHAWTHLGDAATLAAALGVPGPLRGLRIVSHSGSGRVRELAVVAADGTSHAWKGNEFRLLVGSRALRSTLFTVTNADGGWLFSGNGWGHGVGFCQWGAEALGRRGWSAERILRFYFTEATISAPAQPVRRPRPARRR